MLYVHEFVLCVGQGNNHETNSYCAHTLRGMQQIVEAGFHRVTKSP